MRKKALILVVLISSVILTSCSLIPATRLEAMFGSADDTVEVGGGDCVGHGTLLGLCAAHTARLLLTAPYTHYAQAHTP